MAPPEGLRDTVRAVVALAREEQATLLAASLAYFSFVSLVPLLLLVFVALATLGTADLAVRAVELTSETATPGVDVAPLLSARVGQGRATAVGLVVLCWSALRLFRALDGVFGAVYGTHERESVARSLRDAGLVFVTLLGALVLLGVVGVVAPLGVAAGRVLLGPVALFLALVVVFLPMFYVFPEPDVDLREAVPGVVFAAGTWSLSAAVFRVYFVDGLDLYGAAGAVVLVLTWFYVGGLALVLGAVLNAVLAGRAVADDR
ncbi:MAG: YihY/virulence factor BrkB family protein [Haloarculaceae archaeon]